MLSTTEQLYPVYTKKHRPIHEADVKQTCLKDTFRARRVL